jgi:hypothetical protein
MARMIPPYISPEVKSTGEKQIFELFKNDPVTESWIVLHSLNLSQHTRRLYGEIDFLVLAPGLGIFVLEVKSGEVKRKEGVWQFVNRFKEINTSPKGPFVQAQEGMFSILESIKAKFGHGSWLARLLFGFGVMFPHIKFDVHGLEYEGWQVYDRDSRRYPVSKFIEQLSRNTIRKVRHCSWFDEKKSLPTEADLLELTNFLRGDFERIISPSQELQDIEEQLDKYTVEQFHCLDQIWKGEPCLFRGAAGTGKTMIAMESARRAMAENKRVLLVCFNVLLGKWLKSQFAGASNLLTVTSFHKFLKSLLAESIRTTPRSDEYFKFELPLLAVEAIDGGAIEPFDKLIIDEGQDLITEEYLDVFDTLLKGGLSGGLWEIYCDFEKQAIFSDHSPTEMLDMLKQRASFNKFQLTINCRNTRPIGEEISLLTGFKTPPFLPSKIEGLPVEYTYFSYPEEASPALEKILLKLRKQKIKPHNITLLSPRTYQNSLVARIDQNRFPIVDISNSIDDFFTGRKVTFSTIHKFKGLENSHIILTDINRLIDEEFKSLLYVGMSRAKAGLHILLDSRLKTDYKAILKKRI